MFTNRDVYTYANALAEFAKRDLPIKVALSVALKVKALRTYFAVVEEQRKSLLEKYGTKNEAGGLVTTAEGRVKLEGQAAFEKEFEELLSAEAECVLGKPITLAALPDALSLPTEEAAALLALGVLLFAEEE